MLHLKDVMNAAMALAQKQTLPLFYGIVARRLGCYPIQIPNTDRCGVLAAPLRLSVQMRRKERLSFAYPNDAFQKSPILSEKAAPKDGLHVFFSLRFCHWKAFSCIGRVPCRALFFVAAPIFSFVCHLFSFSLQRRSQL
jgi:hypothetical protein